MEAAWTSVKDGLPKKGAFVVAYMADRGTAILTYYHDDFALARVGPIDGFSAHGVTHWMPLPEPPTEDSQ